MALLSPEAIVAGFLGGGLSRPQVSACGMVLRKCPSWSKKTFTIGKAPFTNVSPRKGQADVRVKLGEIARKHKGEKGFINGLPAIAHYVKEELTGYKSDYSMRKEDYPSRHRRTFNTIETLKRKLKIPPGTPGLKEFRTLMR